MSSTELQSEAPHHPNIEEDDDKFEDPRIKAEKNVDEEEEKEDEKKKDEEKEEKQDEEETEDEPKDHDEPYAKMMAMDEEESVNPLQVRMERCHISCVTCQDNWYKIRNHAARTGIYRRIGPENRSEKKKVTIAYWNFGKLKNRISGDNFGICEDCKSVSVNIRKVHYSQYHLDRLETGMFIIKCNTQVAYYAIKNTGYFRFLFSQELREKMDFTGIDEKIDLHDEARPATTSHPNSQAASPPPTSSAPVPQSEGKALLCHSQSGHPSQSQKQACSRHTRQAHLPQSQQASRSQSKNQALLPESKHGHFPQSQPPRPHQAQAARLPPSQPARASKSGPAPQFQSRPARSLADTKFVSAADIIRKRVLLESLIEAHCQRQLALDNNLPSSQPAAHLPQSEPAPPLQSGPARLPQSGPAPPLQSTVSVSAADIILQRNIGGRRIKSRRSQYASLTQTSSNNFWQSQTARLPVSQPARAPQSGPAPSLQSQPARPHVDTKPVNASEIIDEKILRDKRVELHRRLLAKPRSRPQTSQTSSKEN